MCSWRWKADKKGIAIQNMRGYVYDGTAMDDTVQNKYISLVFY